MHVGRRNQRSIGVRTVVRFDAAGQGAGDDCGGDENADESGMSVGERGPGRRARGRPRWPPRARTIDSRQDIRAELRVATRLDAPARERARQRIIVVGIRHGRVVWFTRYNPPRRKSRRNCAGFSDAGCSPRCPGCRRLARRRSSKYHVTSHKICVSCFTSIAKLFFTTTASQRRSASVAAHPQTEIRNP